LIRSESKAIWTSGEPVSAGARRNFPTTSALRVFVSGISFT
jgi:hypothetical protein